MSSTALTRSAQPIPFMEPPENETLTERMRRYCQLFRHLNKLYSEAASHEERRAISHVQSEVSTRMLEVSRFIAC